MRLEESRLCVSLLVFSQLHTVSVDGANRLTNEKMAFVQERTPTRRLCVT